MTATPANPNLPNPTSKPANPDKSDKTSLWSLPREPRRSRGPKLRFTPYAWAKLQWFCHRGDTEIGGLGVCPSNDHLLIEDFITVRQRVSMASVAFDDTAVADFCDQQVDLGRKPSQFLRIWAHTHPGDSPNPSFTDEETFARVFGECDWAVMFILARGGKSYARLRFNLGPGGDLVIPVEVDYRLEFPAADHIAWEAEYAANISEDPFLQLGRGLTAADTAALQQVLGEDNLDPALDLLDADFYAWVGHASPEMGGVPPAAEEIRR